MCPEEAFTAGLAAAQNQGLCSTSLIGVPEVSAKAVKGARNGGETNAGKQLWNNFATDCYG